MQDWHVWDVVLVAESWSVVGRAPLRGKCGDVNKGDIEKPVVCSSFVAKSDVFFSPTPPQALQLLLSHAVSARSLNTGGRKTLVVDAQTRRCRTIPVSVASGACCTTEAKSLQHSRRNREVGALDL